MKFTVDPKNPLPLHAQISQRIELAIATGALAPGEQLPTVRQLSVDLRVNSNTVAKVYADLERRGVVETQRGRGTFVRERPKVHSQRREQHLSALCRSFVQTCVREGYAHEEILDALRSLTAQKEKS